MSYSKIMEKHVVLFSWLFLLLDNKSMAKNSVQSALKNESPTAANPKENPFPYFLAYPFEILPAYNMSQCVYYTPLKYSFHLFI